MAVAHAQNRQNVTEIRAPARLHKGDPGGSIYNLMVVDQLSDDEVDRLFHALADATRRDILRRAILAEQSVSELARRYPVSLTAVQKHVAVLEQAGLVVKRRQGRETRVVAQAETVRRAQELLADIEELWRDRFHRMRDLLTEEDPGGQ
jgi:DNA-binding transcriptional ArsR family regulator